MPRALPQLEKKRGDGSAVPFLFIILYYIVLYYYSLQFSSLSCVGVIDTLQLSAHGIAKFFNILKSTQGHARSESSG